MLRIELMSGIELKMPCLKNNDDSHLVEYIQCDRHYAIGIILWGSHSYSILRPFGVKFLI